MTLYNYLSCLVGSSYINKKLAYKDTYNKQLVDTVAITIQFNQHMKELSLGQLLCSFTLFCLNMQVLFNLTGEWTRLTPVYCVVKVSKLNVRCPFGTNMRADNKPIWTIRFRLRISKWFWDEFPMNDFRFFLSCHIGWL